MTLPGNMGHGPLQEAVMAAARLACELLINPRAVAQRLVEFDLDVMEGSTDGRDTAIFGLLLQLSNHLKLCQPYLPPQAGFHIYCSVSDKQGGHWGRNLYFF